MSLQILVPCKALRQGKSRLAAVLSPAERRDFCASLLERTLSLALALTPAARIAVVTADDEARAIAASRGIAALDDGGFGLNEALGAARDAVLRTEGFESGLLILPIDLPCASAAAIARAADTAAEVAIAPDERKEGTNLLCLAGRARASFRFAFGPGSYERHRRAAAAAGLRVATIEDPNLAFDIDRPEDWRRWHTAQE
jgi:2-phospho-L-lactate/phosphoenolpyruvate guanylyltransferase